MKNRLLTVLIGMLALGASLSLHAQSYMAGFGTTHSLDTYLTPEHFSGGGFTYLYIGEHYQPEKRWSSMMEHEVDFSITEDRSGSISMLEGNYYIYWGKYYNWRLIDDKLRLQAGGLVNGNIGALYAMLSSNNPVQARLSMNIMPSAVATYDLRLGRTRFSLRYEADLHLAGLMFSPNYGQSYYEIFARGDYDHNVVPTTFISAPTMRQIFTIDWHTGKKWNLRVGYLGNYQQAQVNNLKQHVYTHRVLIGISRSL